MHLSIREFNVGLYREHLQDASFLYDQREAYLRDPEIDWPDIRHWEDRFEAHIDALLVGGDLAIELCGELAGAGDAGEVHAALRVLCRQGCKDAVLAVLGALNPEDHDKHRAVAHALRTEAPTAWQSDLLRAFQQQPALTGVLANVFGYRRFAFEEPLRRRVVETSLPGIDQVAWALGRVGSTACVALLWPLLKHDDENVRSAAAVALMRLGDERVLPLLFETAQARPWARRALGLGAGPGAVTLLREALENSIVDTDAVIALGLLGDLSAVSLLLELLDHEELAEPSAVALNTMTGARLYGRVFVPDKVDVDELSDAERGALETSSAPTAPKGNWERRPQTDRAEWRAWLEENKSRFNRRSRWRMGMPHGPAALVVCLKCETAPYVIRAATYEELVIRFGLDVPFEVDLQVSQQWQFLARLEEWVARQSGSIHEGRWYFARQLQA